MKITEKTITDNLEDMTRDKQNIKAFESLGGTSIDYRTFFEIVNIYAKGFKELGVKNGDIVTLCSAGTVDTIFNFCALNKIGAVTQFVNPNYFKFNSKKYINETNSKLLVCLDRFYPLIKDAIAETNVEKIIMSSISEYSSYLYKVLAKRKKVKDCDKIEGVEYIELPDFIRIGETSNIKIDRLPYEYNKDAVITYTSGTTGNPKGVIHTNDSLNNMVTIYEMKNGIGAKEGYRNLVLIPPMYLTSLVHEIITPMSIGATNIMQPLYSPETFAKDLKKYEPQATVGSKSHYLTLEKGKYKKDAFNFVKLAYCGGEAITKTVSLRINDVLDYYGIPPLIIGYGQTEFGTMVMFNNDIPNRTNESGILLPEVKTRIVDLVTGKPIDKGRGELQIQTPTMMKGYINNAEATNDFFEIDENGERWAKSGDVGEIIYQYEGQDVYEVSGRKKDSFIDENNNVVYLFDIETKIEEIEYVKEAEVIALTIDDKKVPIVHVVLDKKAQKVADKVLKLIDATLKQHFKNPSYTPYAYKIRDSFTTSAISGKRAYEVLAYETDGYLKMNENGDFVGMDIISKESLEQNEIVHSRILLKR